MPRKTVILVVDEDPAVRRMLAIALDPEKFQVEECLNGYQSLRLLTSLQPDLVLLDLELPDMNGNDIIPALRGLSKASIIVLTSRSSSEDTVTALNLGADDYVTKPFNMNVLEARIHANLRQTATQVATEARTELRNGPLRMDLARHEVHIGDKLVPFTPKEYDLLRHFIVHRGKILAHKDLLRQVWGDAHAEDTQYLRVFVGQIREKMKGTTATDRLIVTEPGIGYRMEVAEPDGDAAGKRRRED